ncbi:hypothetical protein FNV43_RR12779 [Rhamnella rubrinervis]|uniref:HMA domain-containing protein n=1 Tax=Rhamnella rubrinervis TaxID=2594499 RepID=A0A8K0MIY5_9ROSA|nr:hypothetical protein FNV43_RR12779 [Rhamnella rubrinervis]
MAAKLDTSKEKEKEREKEKEKEKDSGQPKDGKKEKEKEKLDGIINGVYKVNLHCPQCARDIKKPLLRTQGVHNVEVDMEKDEIKVKGEFDPIKILKQIQKLSNKKTDLISPKLQDIKVKETPTAAQKVKETKQEVSRTTSVKVHMHCGKCEKDLIRKLLKQKGVHSVKSDMKAQTVTVNGPIEAEKLINIIRKKVHKHAETVAPKIDKKQENKDKKDKLDGSTSKTENKEEKKEKHHKATASTSEEKSSTESTTTSNETKEINNMEEEIKAVGVKSKDGNYTPYFVHYVYAPQLFSDENPNACTIS